jgi:hypothetical protein
LLSWAFQSLRFSSRPAKKEGSLSSFPFTFLGSPYLTTKQAMNLKVFSPEELAFPTEVGADLFDLFHRLTYTTFLEDTCRGLFFHLEVQTILTSRLLSSLFG